MLPWMLSLLRGGDKSHRTGRSRADVNQPIARDSLVAELSPSVSRALLMVWIVATRLEIISRSEISVDRRNGSVLSLPPL